MDKDDYESPTFQQVIDIIHKAIKNPDVSTAMKDETAWEMASQRFHQEGIEEGIEIGIEQGIEQSRRQQQEATARVMLAEGIDQSVIALATGLTVGEIQTLMTSVDL